MNIIKSRAHGFAAPRISQPVLCRSLVSRGFHPIHLSAYSMSPDQAFSVLRAFLADARHRFVSDDLSCEDRVVRTDVMTRGNQITDHYLVAPRTAAPSHLGDFR
jgi:hypothetical protein